MPLSRLENFLRSPNGAMLYVDPSNFDATDSFENRGDSAARPFKTIQRALVEASRFSYQPGINNDLNDRTTILVSSGTHYIDNRPGLSVTNNGGSPLYRKRTGKNDWTSEVLNEFTENSNFDIFDANNDLYKFNSVEGGVILPRGTSIVALDLRKTKIRPLYIPDPENEDVDRSSIFKITGNCYFTSFTFFDADPQVGAYKDYTYDLVVPKFSHHKLTAFTYADGVNKVRLGLEQTNLTDLQMYYFKIANAYGTFTNRNIPNYPSTQDIEPVVDEYRIVGVLEENLIGISSIRSGDGIGGGILNEITVTTKDLLTNLEAPHNLNPNTPILISGISVNPESYNGSFLVKSVVGPNTFTYITQTVPSVKLPTSLQTSSGLIKVESDTTSSSSPYIFNCSLRSVYGMCSLWADGSKADGFKSVVVAQFTGISLQKDDNAFLLYSQESKNYLTTGQISQSSIERPLHTNSYAIYKPEYENFHIKVSNNSFIQCVSIFAIGFAKHFVTETGGDMSITNSNSNFGALALESYGYRDASFNRDDVGYITHIVPPKETLYSTSVVNWLSFDINLIKNASGNSTNKYLYLYGYDDINAPPSSKVDGFRIGAKIDDEIEVILNDPKITYSSPILMEPFDYTGTRHSSKKEYTILRNIDETNSISSDIITFNSTHQLVTGEKVRVFSDTGQVPDGLVTNTIYYVIRVNSTQIKLAFNFNDAILNSGNVKNIANNGGIIKVVSSVSDKVPGDKGHPIQWDSTANNWYLISSRDTTNGIYSQLAALSPSQLEDLGNFTQLSTFTRRNETRSIEDRLYKIRYVIPKEYSEVRPPGIGFVLQETKTVGITTTSITSSSNLTVKDKRNEKIIISALAGSISNNSQLVTIKTEAPHFFTEGDTIRIKNVKSTFNPTAVGITSTFNGSYPIVNILDSHNFTYRISGVSTNPGTFTNNTNIRTSASLSSLPTVSREKYNNTFIVYRVDTIKSHIPGQNGQDGVYYLTLISANAKTNSSVGFGLTLRSYNQDVRDLYPQVDRDNYVADPDPAVSYADHRVLGKVITNRKTNSLTKESTEFFIQNNIGFGITSVTLSGAGNTTITIKTKVEHKLNSVKTINLSSNSTIQSGAYYGVPLVVSGNPTDAICNYTASAGQVDTSTIQFVDFGSAFTNGQAIVLGDSGASGTISSINSNILDGLELGGFLQNDLNDVFKINSIPDSKTIVLESSKALSAYSPNTNSRIPFGFIGSKGISIESIQFADVNVGIATITTSASHGLSEGNNIKIIGSSQSLYNSNFIIDSVVSSTKFTVIIRDSETTPSATGGVLYKRVLGPNAKSSGKTGENLASRASTLYAGWTTTVTTIDDTTITLSSIEGFRRGDYIQIDNEIIRLISNPTGLNVYNVQRGMFGTRKETSITSGTLVRKINILPIEFRRPSFMRASGHTFEYLGYGPGNYSTSVPQKQNRRLSDDEVLTSQSRKIFGGTVVYSGMNDLGEFYYGAKRVSSVTGQETIIEAPVISYVGDDVDGTDDPSKLSGIFDNLIVRQKITVEGGEDQNETSIFRGPVRFQNNATFQGALDAVSISLSNKKFTIDDETSLRLGNISYVGVPTSFIGRVYLTSPTGGRSWRRWGLISNSADRWDVELDSLNVKDSLTINGIEFTGGSIDFLTVNRLRVIGISTFEGTVYGKNGILSVGSQLDIGDGISTVSIGSSNGVSRLFHSGSGDFNIGINGSGNINIGSPGAGSTLTFGNNGIITLSRNLNSGGTGGAHLSVLNTNTGANADAVISWRSNTKRYWFSGVRALDNSWNVGIAGTSVGIGNQTFNSQSIAFTIAENRNASFSGDLSVSGRLDVSGISTFRNNTVFVGISTFNNGVNVSGISTFNKGIDSVGVSSFRNGINVTGISTFRSGVDVTGTTTFNSNVRVNAVITPNQIADKDGDVGTNGQILTSTGTGLDWESLNNLVPGRIINVVRSVYSTQTIHSLAWTDTGLAASITPSSINSKIIILINQSYTVLGGDAPSSGSIRITKGTSTVLFTPGDSAFASRVQGADNEYLSGVASLQYIDEPGTTSPVTYKTQAHCYDNATRFRTQCGSNAGSLIPGISQIYLIELS